MIEYTVVCSRRDEGDEDQVLLSFEESVKQQLAQGWEPLGGVSVVAWQEKEDGYTSFGIDYFQAMVRERK